MNFRLHFHQMAFSKEDKILIKNLQQLIGYTAMHGYVTIRNICV